jgi:hypothetical protein
VGLNPPLDTPRNEGVGGCNEGNLKPQLGTVRNEGGISNPLLLQGPNEPKAWMME